MNTDPTSNNENIACTTFSGITYLHRSSTVLRIRIRLPMFLGLLDQDPLVRGIVWIRILLSSRKNSKKNLNSHSFVSFFYFLSYPEPNPDPNPLVRGTDPRIRILIKMSWIRNTSHLPVNVADPDPGSCAFSDPGIRSTCFPDPESTTYFWGPSNKFLG